MNYTIAITEEIHGDLSVNFDKDGNQYLVGIRNKETGIYTHKSFKTHEAAQNAYLTIISWVLGGLYSEADKRSMLQEMAE